MSFVARLAVSSDYSAFEEMVIGSFEPITWQKKIHARMGPLNGRNWRERWQARLRQVFETQIVLVGELDDAICAAASAAVDRLSALAFIDILAVGREFQRRGLGRQTLRATIEHLKSLGCQYANLDCLTDNDTANALYRREGFEEVARHIRWFRKI
jgi:ribosomal protein S18 acetylase RimI-like enzyme